MVKFSFRIDFSYKGDLPDYYCVKDEEELVKFLNMDPKNTRIISIKVICNE